MTEPTWQFYRFGLLVTGRGEEKFIHKLFRSLAASGRCHFEVIRRIEQRSPRTSRRPPPTILGTDKPIPDKDAEQIGFPARMYLRQGPDRYVVLIDDLEHNRLPQAGAVFERYRLALDRMLGRNKANASVHFMVPMLEAYYFADARALQAVLGFDAADYDGDVEHIRNPKALLKQTHPSYDEVRDGEAIVGVLDLEHVLANPAACAGLRTLFAWCVKAMTLPSSAQFRLADGVYSIFTGPQLKGLS